MPKIDKIRPLAIRYFVELLELVQSTAHQSPKECYEAIVGLHIEVVVVKALEEIINLYVRNRPVVSAFPNAHWDG